MDFLTTVKEVSVFLTAIIASAVAIKGLSIWQYQLKGTDKYKLSKNVLMRTYDLQEAIMSVRMPFVSSAELSQRESEIKIKENETESEKNIRNESYALWKRTEPMFRAVSELRVSKFEAMALFGKGSAQDIKPIIIKAYELRNAQTGYFQMRIDPSIKYQEIMDKYRQIVYEMPEEEDIFKKELDEIVSKIENKFSVFLE